MYAKGSHYTEQQRAMLNTELPPEKVGMNIPQIGIVLEVPENGTLHISALNAKRKLLDWQDHKCIYCGDKINLATSWLWPKNEDWEAWGVKVGVLRIDRLEVLCYECKEEYE